MQISIITFDPRPAVAEPVADPAGLPLSGPTTTTCRTMMAGPATSACRVTAAGHAISTCRI